MDSSALLLLRLTKSSTTDNCLWTQIFYWFRFLYTKKKLQIGACVKNWSTEKYKLSTVAPSWHIQASMNPFLGQVLCQWKQDCTFNTVLSSQNVWSAWYQNWQLTRHVHEKLGISNPYRHFKVIKKILGNIWIYSKLISVLQNKGCFNTWKIRPWTSTTKSWFCEINVNFCIDFTGF